MANKRNCVQLVIVGICVILTTGVTTANNIPSEVIIGGLFSKEPYDTTGLQAFKIAVDYVNTRTDILPNTVIRYAVNVTETAGAFDNIRMVCSLVQQGVSLMVGPAMTTGVKAVTPVLSALHMPQITPFATDPTLSVSTEEFPYLFKMSAPDMFQSSALLDLIRYFGWTRIGILATATDYGRNGVAALQTHVLKNDWTLTAVMYFSPHSNLTQREIRPLLQEIKAKGTRIVVLNCLAEYARPVFAEADNLKMLEKGWAWIVTDGITALDNLYNTCADVPAHMVGMVGTRPSFKPTKLYRELQGLWQNATGNPFHNDDRNAMRVFDAVLAASQGIHNYLEAGHVLTPYQVDESVCTSGQVSPWKDGQRLTKFISQVSIEGVTNQINFTNRHFPGGDILYEIINLRKKGWTEVGMWLSEGDEDAGGNLTMDSPVLFCGNTGNVPTDSAVDMKNITLRVTTLLEAPFVMRDDDPDATYPLKGFCVDLLRQLQKTLGFHFEMYVVPDGSYGVEDPDTHKWGGLVGELLNDDADLVIAPLTISYEREQVVDFTKPFLDLGLIILMAKETPTQSFLAFLEPFSWTLWLAVGGAFVLCGVANTLVSWLSPYGNRGRYSSRLDSRNQKFRAERNVFNLWTSLWYSFSQWMMQGSETSPRGLSGRLVYGLWYFVVMVVSATYTANLAAFLTVQRLDSGINSLDDLANQRDIKYGTVEDSATQKFFETQVSDPYMMVYNFMEGEKTYVGNTSYGLQKVNNSYGKPKNERYAFIFDSTLLEYTASQRPCQVDTVGRVFNQFGYGLALQKNSPYLDRFSLEVLRLRQSGFLVTLKNKWVTSGACHTAADDSSKTTADKATLGQMAGVFAFMIGGIILALIIILIECCVAARQDIKKLKKNKTDKKARFCGACGRRCRSICRDIQQNCFTCVGFHQSSDEDEEMEYSQGESLSKKRYPGRSSSYTNLNVADCDSGLPGRNNPVDIVMGDVVMTQKPGFFNGFNTHIP